MFVARFVFTCSSVLAISFAAAAIGDEPANKRVLLIGQSPDDHPRATHEYLPGMHVLEKLLDGVEGLETHVVRADGDWLEGPSLLKNADGAVLFVSEGAKWIHADPRRLEAFAQLAARGGGLVAVHWGMGTRDAANIDGFLKLFGGCHGGPDRQYKKLTTDVRVATRKHPVTFGIEDFKIYEEFYYKLKFVNQAKAVTPILQANIDGNTETVAWAWGRADGGRSFGFSGLHFHVNWEKEEYRRLIAQGVLWTLDLPVPKQGLTVNISPTDLSLPK